MIINNENYELGNKAMASVLQLYYQVVKEGGLFDAQTVYLSGLDFDPFKHLEVEVHDDYSFEIEQNLLREGSIIYLIIELSDAAIVDEENYINWDYSKKTIQAYEQGKFRAIPEARYFIEALKKNANWQDIAAIQKTIYKKYILTRFKETEKS